MIKITIGESYEIQATFNWYGGIGFVGPDGGYSGPGILSFFSKDSSDLRKAKILKEKYPELFTNFDFYTEEGVDKVSFQTTSATKLLLQ